MNGYLFPFRTCSNNPNREWPKILCYYSAGTRFAIEVFSVAGAAAAGGGDGAGAGAAAATGVGSGEDDALPDVHIAEIAVNIFLHVENQRLSASQVMHLLNVDNNIDMFDVVQYRPTHGIFLYPMARLYSRDLHRYTVANHHYRTVRVQDGDQEVFIRYRRSVAVHTHGEIVANFNIVSRRYFIEGGARYLVHYIIEVAHLAQVVETPVIPSEPLVP